MPAPTSETLAIDSSTFQLRAPSSATTASVARLARTRSSLGVVNEMSVVPDSETFWMIMSTFTLASASMPKTMAATPGRSGTSRMVTLASEVSCVTPEMIACSMVSSPSLTMVPGLSLKLERQWMTTP